MNAFYSSRVKQTSSSDEETSSSDEEEKQEPLAYKSFLSTHLLTVTFSGDGGGDSFKFTFNILH
jgi:hypothetical protein